jgi:glutamine amidotransferase/cyclase
MQSTALLTQSQPAVCRAPAASRARGSRQSVAAAAAAKEVTLLDYGAGNVRSVRNAIKKLGYTIKDVSPSSAAPPGSRVVAAQWSPAAAVLHAAA